MGSKRMTNGKYRVAGSRVTVNTLYPGHVDTAMQEEPTMWIKPSR